MSKGKSGSSGSTRQHGYCVHESAYIDQPCEIGEGTRIWHFAHVMRGAKIGRNCVLGQNTSVAGGAIVGNNVKIQNNVSIYSGVIVEDDVFLGPSCVLTNVTNPRSEIRRHSLYERTLIHRGATVGANATIVCGVELGRYSFVGAGSVVTRDVPDYALVRGVPARQVGWISRHGIPLPHPDADGIMVCAESGYRYQQTTSTQVSCLDLDEEVTLPPEASEGKVKYREYERA